MSEGTKVAKPKRTRKPAVEKSESAKVLVENIDDVVLTAMASVGKVLDIQYKTQKMQAMAQATIEVMVELGYRKV